MSSSTSYPDPTAKFAILSSMATNDGSGIEAATGNGEVHRYRARAERTEFDSRTDGDDETKESMRIAK